MIKKVFSFIVFSIQLFAYSYDNAIIEIEAKLFPKIAVLEKTTQKEKTDTLQVYIVHTEVDHDTAQKFKTSIEKFYSEKLINKKISVSIIIQEQLSLTQEGMLIVLYHPTKNLKEIAQWANEHHRISFIYDYLEIEYGFLGSIYADQEIKPYLNRQTIQKYNFNFDTYLLGLSKFYE
ncbi:hypothetical protein [Sulfurimonas sp.]|uniref:hypothetical protein n=1 Tax=Sulfurimonas sp. TaxID=2022749 RepID=UPI003D114251